MGDARERVRGYTDADIEYQYSNDYSSENYSIYDPLTDEEQARLAYVDPNNNNINNPNSANYDTVPPAENNESNENNNNTNNYNNAPNQYSNAPNNYNNPHPYNRETYKPNYFNNYNPHYRNTYNTNYNNNNNYNNNSQNIYARHYNPYNNQAANYNESPRAGQHYAEVHITSPAGANYSYVQPTTTGRSLTESGFDPNFEPVYGSVSSSSYSNSNYSSYSASSDAEGGSGGFSASGSSSLTSTSNLTATSSLSSLSSPSVSLNSSSSSVTMSVARTISSVVAHAGSFSTPVSTGLSDSRRREAINPYFQIKTNLTNLLKDFTGLETPYVSSASYNKLTSSIPALMYNKTRNWNEEFQTLLDRKEKIDKYEKSTNVEESVDVYEKLSNLEKDFVYSANLYGKIIISEQYQENSSKTILPANVGGIAGGTKYMVNGILFKFVKDDIKLQLYGSDEFAMKTASHEKNGLVSLYHCGVRELRVPLMAYIDYRGYRLMALSMLPISNNTLIYGSNDGGTTVHMDDPKFNELIKLAAQRLNLKQHVVGADKNGMGGKMIYGPADIEGHIGSDGRYYLLDFARLAPPEPVTYSSAPGSFLYNLMRLELVKKNQVPLSSDAFSWIGRIDGPVHNAEVRKAYKELVDDILPKFAESIDQNSKSLDNIEEFIYKLHSQGINVRQLGLLRTKVSDPEVKNKILLEVVSRVIKNQLRYMLRQEMKTSGASDKPYRKLTVNFLNLLCGGVNMNFTTLYWNDVIKNDLESKFKDIFSPTETLDLFDLCVCQFGIHLVKRICKITGIHFKKEAIKSMQEGVAGFRIVDPDLKEFESVVTRLNMIDYSDGMALFYKARTMEKFDDNKSSQLRLLTMARGRLRAARYSMCSTEEAVYYNAIVEQFVAKLQKTKSSEERVATLLSAEQAFDELLQLRTHIQLDILVAKAKCIRSRAKLESDDATALVLYDSAFENLQFALQIDKSDVALYIMGKIVLAKWRLSHDPAHMQQAETLMQNAINKDPTSPTYAYGMATILLELHDSYLTLFYRTNPMNFEPIIDYNSKEDCVNIKAMLQKIGQLLDVAVQAYPKYYIPKIMARLNATSTTTDTHLIWNMWGYARFSPLLVDAMLNFVSNVDSLQMIRCKFVDETLNILTSQMPKLQKLNLKESVNNECEPLSNDVVIELVNPNITKQLTHLNLANSLITRELLGSIRSFETLVKLDLTDCASFEVVSANVPHLKSLKIVGCNLVTDDALYSFLLYTKHMETLYIPDHISGETVDKIASIQPALKSLRVPPIASEYQMASILDKLPELTKLDLISCNSISIEFADRVNNICKLIRKVRDCKGTPHLFTGNLIKKIVTTNVNVGHMNHIDINWNDLSMAPIRIERKKNFNSSLPVVWSVQQVKFRNLTNSLKELFQVIRSITHIFIK